MTGSSPAPEERGPLPPRARGRRDSRRAGTPAARAGRRSVCGGRRVAARSVRRPPGPGCGVGSSLRIFWLDVNTTQVPQIAVRSLRRSDLPKVRQVEGRALTAPQYRSGRPMQRERGEVRKTSCSSFHLLEALDQGQNLPGPHRQGGAAEYALHLLRTHRIPILAHPSLPADFGCWEHSSPDSGWKPMPSQSSRPRKGSKR
ncbi:uncharacterized protein [Canis lupus baileyi]|uniref:uncharacterized protein n=1 Tax=Canis lupus baileyi TaxID=143281 RepID=UPI0006B3D1BC